MGIVREVPSRADQSSRICNFMDSGKVKGEIPEDVLYWSLFLSRWRVAYKSPLKFRVG